MNISVPSKPEAVSLRDVRLAGARLLPLLALAVAVGVVVVAATLSAVLDGGGRWTEITAAAGIVAMVVAVAVLLGTAQGWANGTRTSMAAVSTAVVGMGALALVLVTYVGGAGDVGLPASSASTANSVSDEGAALSSQQSNNEIQPPGYAHDVGQHPTLGQFLEMDNATVLANVPGGTVLPPEVDPLRQELAAAQEFALDHDTVEKARAAGYDNTTNDVPFMGAHFLHQGYLMDGVFDPGKPEGLLFSRLGNPDGEWQLVGVWYLILPGQAGATADAPPEGFTGNLDLWHEHYGLCTRNGVISENNTREGCLADNGNFIGDLRWMMHAWVYPDGMENPEGVFVYLNNELWQEQKVAADTDAPGLGTGAE